jgi:hypothetical protein
VVSRSNASNGPLIQLIPYLPSVVRSPE